MKPPCKYSVGQRVEILVADFAVSGFPLAWTAGTVTDVCEMPGGGCRTSSWSDWITGG